MKYRALVGLDTEKRRFEPGDLVSDLPKTSVCWLLEQGLIEPVDAPAPAEAPVEQGEV